MKPTVYFLHGCPGSDERGDDPEKRTYDKHWMPWAEKALTERGYNVVRPLFPTPWNTDYRAFKEAFSSYHPNDDDVLVGHSCGGTFLVRWLGETHTRVAKLILVAPWKVPTRHNPLEDDFYGYAIDSGIRERVGKIVIFSSDDDEADGIESAKIYHEALGGEHRILPGRGHFTRDDMGTEEFPELIRAIVEN